MEQSDPEASPEQEHNGVDRAPIEMSRLGNGVDGKDRGLGIIPFWEIVVPGLWIRVSAVKDFAPADDAISVRHEVLGQCHGFWQGGAPGLIVVIDAGGGGANGAHHACNHCSRLPHVRQHRWHHRCHCYLKEVSHGHPLRSMWRTVGSSPHLD